MKKRVFGRQFKRDIHERKALFKGLASSLVMYERIETTEEKAKAIKGHVEKLVTKALNTEGIHTQGLLQPYLSPDAVKKLVTDVAPRFAKRPGGYTRIIKIGQRFNDNANMVWLEWVEKSGTKAVETLSLEKTNKKETPVKKAVKKTVVKKETTEKVKKEVKKPKIKKENVK